MIKAALFDTKLQYFQEHYKNNTVNIKKEQTTDMHYVSPQKHYAK